MAPVLSLASPMPPAQANLDSCRVGSSPATSLVVLTGVAPGLLLATFRYLTLIETPGSFSALTFRAFLRLYCPWIRQYLLQTSSSHEWLPYFFIFVYTTHSKISPMGSSDNYDTCYSLAPHPSDLFLVELEFCSFDHFPLIPHPPTPCLLQPPTCSLHL